MVRSSFGPVIPLFGLLAPASAQVLEDSLLTALPAVTSDGFGDSLSLDGDTLVVGAYDGDLAVVFERSAGAWIQAQTLVGQDTQDGDEFGKSVAVLGDTILIGSPLHIGSSGGTGAAYVFTRVSGAWSEVSKLSGSDSFPGDWFGNSVDLDGTRALVGAPLHDPGSGFGAGTAYIFEGSGATWNQEAKLTANDGDVFDFFGFDLALSGEYAVVGAEFDDDQGSESGSAYVYIRTGSSWAQSQKLLASDGIGEALFGIAVDIHDDRLIVGAPREFTGVPGLGAAYVYELMLGVWTEVDILRGASAARGDNFGVDVALEGDIALVGAYLYDDSSLSLDSGAAYAFREGGGLWVEVDSFAPSDPSPDANFGVSAGISGGTIAFGAPKADSAIANGGAVYLYQDSFRGPPMFCTGGGGGLDGCTPCPCGNDVPSTLGGCLNSQGGSAQLMRKGVSSVSSDLLRFEVTSAVPQSFGILSSGDDRLPTNPANPCFGTGAGVQALVLDGLRCAGGAVQRHGARATDGSGSIGEATPGWGFPHGPSGGLIAQGGFVAGATRHFQVIYRENPAFGCATGQNTTQGVTVVFLP